MRSTSDLALDNAGAFQKLDVLRNRRQRHIELRRKLANVVRPSRKKAYNLATRRARQRLKNTVEAILLIFNHLV